MQPKKNHNGSDAPYCAASTFKRVLNLTKKIKSNFFSHYILFSQFWISYSEFGKNFLKLSTSPYLKIRLIFFASDFLKTAVQRTTKTKCILVGKVRPASILMCSFLMHAKKWACKRPSSHCAIKSAKKCKSLFTEKNLPKSAIWRDNARCLPQMLKSTVFFIIFLMERPLPSKGARQVMIFF